MRPRNRPEMYSKVIANFAVNYARGGQFIVEGIELEDRMLHHLLEEMHDPEMPAFPVNADEQAFRMSQQKETITGLIDGVWDQDLKCPICFNLIVDPRECETCQNLVCNECILHNLLQCMNRCGQSFKPMGSIHRAFKSKFDAVKINCLNDCGEVVGYSVYEKHVNELCTNKKATCRHLGCGRKFKPDEINQHHEECDFKLQACELCSVPVKRSVLEIHNLNDCQFRVIKCPNCDASYRYNEGVHNCVVFQKKKIESLENDVR